MVYKSNVSRKQDVYQVQAIEDLTDRQAREVAYHASRAQEKVALVNEPVVLDIVSNAKRRPWNGYWYFWDLVSEHTWVGRRVLVAGSGYGEDAIRMATLGATVSAFDISPDSVSIAEARTQNAGMSIDYSVAPLEAMPYDDESFDAILLIDIMHHVEVSKAMEEVRRVVKPGGLIFVNEIYTHDFIENSVRRSALVEKVLYPRLKKRIYGTDCPYITEDERKLNDHELRSIEGSMTVVTRRWFNVLVGRLFSPNRSMTARIDRLILAILGGTGRYIAGRVVFVGRR